MLRGGPRPPILQGSAGRVEVGQEGGGFQGAGVSAGSAGWDHHGGQAAQTSPNLVRKAAERSFSIVTVVFSWTEHYCLLEKRSRKLHKV